MMKHSALCVLKSGNESNSDPARESNLLYAYNYTLYDWVVIGVILYATYVLVDVINNIHN